MALNEKSVRELLDASTPAPWNVAMLDPHRETGVIDNDHAQANQRLAALAPELAQDWLRMRCVIEEMREIVEADQDDFGEWDTMDAQARLRWENNYIAKILGES